MTILPTIDIAAPAWLSPMTRRLVTIDLSRGCVLPALVEMAEPTSSVEALRIAEASEVLEWLGILEGDLHCVAKDSDGRAILTTWMDIEVFAQFVASMQGSAIGAPLRQARDAWLAAGAGLVHFDFYALEEEASAALAG